MRKRDAKQQRRESIKQEDDFAARAGGRRVLGSGAIAGMPGDVRLGRTHLAEMKLTGNTQVTIKAEVLEKIFTEAWASGRRPLQGLRLNGRNYLIEAEEDFLEREELLRELLKAEETPSQARTESSQCCGGRSG